MEEYVHEDRRIFERFPAKLSVRYSEGLDKEYQAQTYNISARGLCLVVSDSLPANTRVDLWLQIRDKGEPLNIKGVVIWSKEAQFNRYRIGIRLDESDLMGLSRVLRVK